jgi:CRP-like cAMP-binding protein
MKNPKGLDDIANLTEVDRLKEYLQKHYRINEHDWNLIHGFFKPALIRSGEYFLRAGRICHRMGFIAKGVMRYTHFKEDGKEITCNFVSENDFVGEPDSLLNHIPTDISQQAVTDCRLITFTLEDMNSCRKVFPRFTEITADITQKTIRSLLVQRTFLADRDAAGKYQYFMIHYPQFLQRVPLGYIASFLDITQQSLSRLRKNIS